MRREYEMAHLISMTAHARILAACSTNKGIIEMSGVVKELGLELAKSIGMTEEQFNMLTVQQYIMLTRRKPEYETD